jgi:hypothetical protein
MVGRITANFLIYESTNKKFRKYSPIGLYLRSSILSILKQNILFKILITKTKSLVSFGINPSTGVVQYRLLLTRFHPVPL